MDLKERLEREVETYNALNKQVQDTTAALQQLESQRNHQLGRVQALNDLFVEGLSEESLAMEAPVEEIADGEEEVALAPEPTPQPAPSLVGD